MTEHSGGVSRWLFNFSAVLFMRLVAITTTTTTAISNSGTCDTSTPDRQK